MLLDSTGNARMLVTFQKHGVLAVREGLCLPAGQVRICPAHACATAAFDAYHACRGREVTALWSRCRGWRSVPHTGADLRPACLENTIMPE